MTEPPLDIVAKLARDIVVPMFRDDAIVLCGKYSNLIAYVVECGAHLAAYRAVDKSLDSPRASDYI